MKMKYLEESVVDMLACAWERKLGGREDVNSKELAYVEDRFLERYLQEDKCQVKDILDKISRSNL